MYIHSILFTKGILIFLNVTCKGVDNREHFVGFINFFLDEEICIKKGK